MIKPVLAALAREPIDHPPVWIMRQAGRHLPEYRDLRARYSFHDAVSIPAIAAEITLQPVRRYGMDAAVIFADIMTPLQAMGVDVEFNPGPQLRPHSLSDVIDLDPFEPDRVAFVADTIRLVKDATADSVAVVGFAGAPLTLLAYLVHGGGSKDFLALRAALRADPTAAAAALDHLAASMRSYLEMQIDAGADVVQLFDTWANVLDRSAYASSAAQPAERALKGLRAPSIYFAPGSGHTLDLQRMTGADAYGLDWRMSLRRGWDMLGDVAVQGNLDPAVLLTDPVTIESETRRLLADVAGRPGHVLNLGHGIDRTTPPEHVSAFVAAARPR